MTDNANALYQEVGLPLVTPGEHGDFTQSLESLAAPEIIHESIMAKAVNLSEETLMNTVHYINLNPTSSAGLQTQLDAVANNIKLSNNFFIAKANSALDARVDAKQLSHDEVKMANYRVKVMNHLAINTPWYALSLSNEDDVFLISHTNMDAAARFSTNSMQTQRKIFTMKKEDFHLELIKTFTEGMNLPLSSIAAKLENFLTNVNNIINSQTKSSDESLMFFISITSYQLDDVERWQPCKII